ncbi:MAG TPA: ROK family transcriptional regulator [Anaerolineales bacterium]|mgnify:FL=1|nr:ROK family transcriptional regulator [Anaerolineales bacterium]HRK88942.1 ROK family transcriptional regulator [Anaerolineales bacterium]
MNNSPLGNRELIRAINRSTILNSIKTNGAIPRAEIARLTGLSPATVTGITAELIQDNLVFEKESGDSSGGRRPIMLAINPNGGCVVGIKVMEDHALGALTDLEASLLGKQSYPLTDTSPEGISRSLSELVAELLKMSENPAPNLMGVGVGLAGIVDAGQGLVRQSPFFGWNDVPLRDMIQNLVNVPVYVDNDVNTLAFAEKWFGAGRGIDNFLVVTVGRGIGLGIVANGQFNHGARGGAGEIGHTVIQPGGELCACGKRGCLEMYASEPALLRQAAKAFEQGQLSSLPKTPEELIALAASGEKVVQEIFARAGELLGQSIANLVNIFNPQRVLINGEGVRAGNWLFDPMRSAIDEHTMPGLRQDVSILVEPLGDDAWARGAASLVLHELFESPIKRQREVEAV